MTELQPHHKKSHQQHQNCENCVRQKKQNENWIKIYQRLQQVQKNTHRISNAVKEHKLSNETNRSFYKSYEQNIISFPKVKRTGNQTALEDAGIEVAIGILEKQSKSKLIQQNQRLKKILSQMRKQKWEEDSKQRKSVMNSQQFTEKRNYVSNLAQTDFSLSLANSSFQNREYEGAHKVQKVHFYETKENSSTKSSSFNSARTKNSFDLSRYNDLNLWLYQNDKHSKLQEDLFASKQPDKKKSVKRKSQILPSINIKK